MGKDLPQPTHLDTTKQEGWTESGSLNTGIGHSDTRRGKLWYYFPTLSKTYPCSGFNHRFGLGAARMAIEDVQTHTVIGAIRLRKNGLDQYLVIRHRLLPLTIYPIIFVSPHANSQKTSHGDHRSHGDNQSTRYGLR